MIATSDGKMAYDIQPLLRFGVRAIVERNTMRYYLAIEAYVAGLNYPADKQLEKRLQLWYDGTEQYPRQLHEVGREDYFAMKKKEIQRQNTE